MNVEIRPLSSDLIGDYFTLFDGVKFCDHPDWSACYCYSFHFTGTSEQWNKESNKASVEKLYDLDDPGDEQICSIVCFLIHQDYRRMGVARKLLERIISDQSSEGQYKGPMGLYLDYGFEAVKILDTYTIVRKFL